jgi:hypothetical protein
VAACSYIIFRHCPDSWIATAWASYARFVEYTIKHVPFLCRSLRGDWNDPLFQSAIAVFAFLPQFGVALLGGMSAAMLTKSCEWTTTEVCAAQRPQEMQAG